MAKVKLAAADAAAAGERCPVATKGDLGGAHRVSQPPRRAVSDSQSRETLMDARRGSKYGETPATLHPKVRRDSSKAAAVLDRRRRHTNEMSIQARECEWRKRRGKSDTHDSKNAPPAAAAVVTAILAMQNAPLPLRLIGRLSGEQAWSRN